MNGRRYIQGTIITLFLLCTYYLIYFAILTRFCFTGRHYTSDLLAMLFYTILDVVCVVTMTNILTIYDHSKKHLTKFWFQPP